MSMKMCEGRRAMAASAGALAIAAALAAGAAQAVDRGQTPFGVAYVSGGVSIEELRALHERREGFSLWVITAARSGAHLADVRVTIRDENKRAVFDGRLDGPWLFIDLPLGRYEVAATAGGQTQTRVSTIHPADRHQVFFYFDTGDLVSPDARRQFPGNPYGQQ
jgi:hypothetical protein